MPAAGEIGTGLVADDGVAIGYPPSRPVAGSLVLGRDARLRTGTTLYAGSRIGDRFESGHNVVVREGCFIGDDVRVWSNAVIDYACSIGNRVKIHAGCYIAQYSQIDDDAFLAPGVVLANDLYPGRPGSAESMRGPSIGRRAVVGANATVLPFVRIGDGALVGAGAVVTRDVPEGKVAYGSPAVCVGAVDDLPDISARLTRADVS